MRKQFLFKRFNCFINSANIRYFPWGQAKTVAFQSLVSFFYTANTRHWLSACSNVQFFSQLRQYSAFSTSSEGNFFSNVQLFLQLRQCSAFSVRQGQSGLICKCSAVSSTPTILPFFFIKKNQLFYQFYQYSPLIARPDKDGVFGNEAWIWSKHVELITWFSGLF